MLSKKGQVSMLRRLEQRERHTPTALARSSPPRSSRIQAYTARFKKIMNKIEGFFDLKHLTTTTTGKPKSLDYRVQFHYHVKGQLKQISPWHDIPLDAGNGLYNAVIELPKMTFKKMEADTKA